MFYKDTRVKMDAINPVADNADANMDLKARYAFTKQSHTLDMIGPIHSDIFFQDRLSNSPCKKEATTRQGMQKGANFCTTLLLLYHTSDWLNQQNLPQLRVAVYLFILSR